MGKILFLCVYDTDKPTSGQLLLVIVIQKRVEALIQTVIVIVKKGK